MKRLLAVLTILVFGLSLLAVAQEGGKKPAKEKKVVPSAAHPVDINTATKEDLEQVPGLGAYADKIIEGRPYKSKSELVNRSIVPMAVYSQFKDRITASPVKGEAKPAKAKKDKDKDKDAPK